MPSASDPRQQNRTRQPASRPAQPGQRPAQPTQRAAQPAARPAQSFSHSAQPVQRTGQQPSARSAQPAGGTRFKQQASTQRVQAPSRIRITLSVPTALLRLRARAITRTSAVVHKRKSSPVPMIIGGVVAVLALVAIVFFVVPAVKGFFGGEDAKVAAGQQVTITIPDGASGDTIASILSENHIVENPKDYYAAVKSSTPICRSSLVIIRSPHSWMRPRLFSSSWKAPTRAPMR